MRKIDIDMLTKEEAQVVDDSFDEVSLPSRFATIMLGAFIAAGVALLLLALDASAGVMATAFVIVVAIAAFEKTSYARAQLYQANAIRKLVHRIEDLEGVPETPDNAKPTQLAVESRRAS